MPSGTLGQDEHGGSSVPNPAPLSQVAVPQPIGGDIINQTAAIRLGKALFWDIQTGGDGQTACASCHFRAGADNRVLNTINPGPNGIFESGGVTAWELRRHPECQPGVASFRSAQQRRRDVVRRPRFQ